MKKILLFLLFLSFSLCLSAQNTVDKNKVRLSIITVDPEQLQEYNDFLKEGIEAAMKLEPGVLVLYAMSEKEYPNKIKILEIYANEEAYQNHIKTPHFLKYKVNTLEMVQTLELLDMDALIPESLQIKYEKK